ncbi:cation channel sperm-associated targeting subunit tau, partial [Ctenodactylus gundi]
MVNKVTNGIGHFTEELQMLNKKALICLLDVEFMFCYGNFGYGFSHQLKCLQRPVEPAMFLHVAPAPEREANSCYVCYYVEGKGIQILGNSLTAAGLVSGQNTKVRCSHYELLVFFINKNAIPQLVPPELSSSGGAPADTRQPSQPPVVQLEKPPPQRLPEKLQKMKKEYRKLKTWEEKAGYLENILSPKLENKSLKSDVIMLKSLLKHIFNVFFKYNQSERRRQPVQELQRLIQRSYPSDTEYLEEIQGNFNKAEKTDGKPILSPKLRIFLEELSESEVKYFKAELSKHIQHYLVEKLSDSGHITEEDLLKIHQNLYQVNEEVDVKGQRLFREKYSQITKEVMSFVNNFNHHFIDKHLEITLISFLSDILQNYFLRNLSERSLFNETESEGMPSSWPSLRNQRAPVPLWETGQDIPRENFGRRLEVNMKYPSDNSLQNCLVDLPENELLSLEAGLKKHIHSLFIEKLSHSGLLTGKQLKEAATVTHSGLEAEDHATLRYYHQRWKGTNNNNKNHLVTFAQHKKALQTLYKNRNEICDEKGAPFPESQSSERKDLKSSEAFFPEVLKKENVKTKVRMEREQAERPSRSPVKSRRTLRSALPAVRPQARGWAPRTPLHWTARKTVHDCLDKYEDLHVTSVKYPIKTKSRAKLAGRSP